MVDDITYLARLNHRGDRRRFGIKYEDRFLHAYIIGKTGVGKSTLLSTMAAHDLALGHGFALIDPHGDLVDGVRRQAHAIGRDVIYLDATDPNQPYGYNPLKHVRPDRIPLAASGLLEVFKKMWADAWGVRMEHILRNALYALLEQSDATLSDIPRLFRDRAYRKRITASLKNEPVRLFWEKEFERYSFAYRADGVASIQNKIGAFLADPLMRRILAKPREPISLRRIMDEGQVLLVNLGKGRIGEDSSSLLGGLLVTTIGLAAYSRADTAPSDQRINIGTAPADSCTSQIASRSPGSVLVDKEVLRLLTFFHQRRHPEWHSPPAGPGFRSAVRIPVLRLHCSTLESVASSTR
jgi:hypothetical protein